MQIGYVNRNEQEVVLATGFPPSLSTSGETLTIEESVNLEGENGERRNVGDEHEWSCARG